MIEALEAGDAAEKGSGHKEPQGQAQPEWKERLLKVFPAGH